MKTITSLIFLLQVFSISYSQNIGTSKVKPSEIRNWTPKLKVEYSGIYHFGESDSESSLFLFFDVSNIIAQIRSTKLDTINGRYIPYYENLTNVSIDSNGGFYSDQYQGRFVFYSTQNHKGILIINPWTVWIPNDETEIGYKLNRNVYDSFKGRFPEASMRILLSEELASHDSLQLEIMKNEILARYGYKFDKSVELHEYFITKSWYEPQFKDVNDFLTSIEMKNIELIDFVLENRK